VIHYEVFQASEQWCRRVGHIQTLGLIATRTGHTLLTFSTTRQVSFTRGIGVPVSMLSPLELHFQYFPVLACWNHKDASAKRWHNRVKSLSDKGIVILSVPTAGDATGGPALSGGKGLVGVIGAAGETRVVAVELFAGAMVGEYTTGGATCSWK
jgi:hypothetical protein